MLGTSIGVKLFYLQNCPSFCLFMVCYTKLCQEPLSSSSENKGLGFLHDDRTRLTLMVGPGELTRVGLSFKYWSSS